MSTYKREYLLHLPLPLAQLYQAANNARQAIARAEKALCAIEAAVRLSASVMVAAYRNEITQGLARDEGLGRVLQRIERPTLENWSMILAAMAKYFGTRPDAATHPLGHIHAQLNEPRPDAAELIALYQSLEADMGDEPTGTDDFSLRRLLDIVMSYREDQASKGDETLTGATTDEHLLPALNALFAPGVFDLIGPEDSRLVWVEEVRSTGSGTVDVDGTELVGTHGERLDTVTIPEDQAGRLAPERVAVCWPTRPAPLPIDPLLHFQEGDLNVDVMFALQHIEDRAVSYTVYSEPKPVRENLMATSFAQLLADLTGEDASQAPMETLADVAEMASEFSELLPNQIRVRCLERPDGDAPWQWTLTTDDEVTIGREATNTCVVNNPRVSRRHGRLEFTPEGWKYENLGSNGTLKDGTRTDSFLVVSGDIVQLAASGPRVQFDLPEL